MKLKAAELLIQSFFVPGVLAIPGRHMMPWKRQGTPKKLRRANRKAERRAAADAAFRAQLTKERTVGISQKYLSAHARRRVEAQLAAA